MSTQTNEATSIDHAKSGTRCKNMPAGRRDMTVVAMTHCREHECHGRKRQAGHRQRHRVGMDAAAICSTTPEPAVDQYGNRKDAPTHEPCPQRQGRGPGKGNGGRADL